MIERVCAFLRDGQAVVITGRLQHATFPLVGRRNGTGAMDLWRHDGRWREDGAEHPLDITHVLTPCGVKVEFQTQKS